MWKNIATAASLFLFLVISSAATAQAPQSLFIEVPDIYRSTYPESVDDPTVIRSKNVRLNFGALVEQANARTLGSKNPVLLNLFDDVAYYVSLRKSGAARNGSGTILSGKIEGMESGRATFVINGNIVSGVVENDDGDFFEIRYGGDGAYSVLELDRTGFPDIEHILVDRNNAQSYLARENSENGTEPDVLADLADDGSVIDVMVIYSTSAREAAGGVEAMENRINLAAELANQSFVNSGVETRIRIVHKEETGYDDSAGYYDALKELRGKKDGVLDQVHSKRDEHGADIVSLWVKNGEYCGLGYQMVYKSGFDSYAFNVVNYNCAIGTYAFAHEVGHNLGAAHDRDNAYGTALYPWAYGYQQRSSGTKFYTLMSYPCSGCRVINFWSNPDVNYSGWPTGEPGVADNRTTLNSTRKTAANWRRSVHPVAGQELQNETKEDEAKPETEYNW